MRRVRPGCGRDEALADALAATLQRMTVPLDAVGHIHIKCFVSDGLKISSSKVAEATIRTKIPFAMGVLSRGAFSSFSLCLV